MKNISSTTFILFLMITACTQPHHRFLSHNEEEYENKNPHELTPSEYFFIARQYPDFTWDADAFSAQLKKEMQQSERDNNAGYNQLWTTEGPGNIGGRVNVMIIHPTNSNIMYAGCATGGIFKTNDGGNTWVPVFDAQPFLPIGALGFDPQNPEVIYAGTGDPNISGYAFIGDGIYKSSNGGLTWTHLGLEQQRIISKIIVDPQNSNIIYAATMGIPFTPNNERGLYKSTDGGNTWQQILFLANNAGVIDLVMDFNNPNTLYAAGWNRIRNNQQTIISGNKSKLYKTTNGGLTWDTLTNGLPQGVFCRPSITMSGTNPNILYATYSDTSAELYGIYKTTNGGNSWTPLSTFGLPANTFNGQGWFSGGIKVNPANNNDLWLCGVDLWHSTDGGNSWALGAPEWWQYIVHADHHDVVFKGNAVFTCTDGGIYKTTDGGMNWIDMENIPNNQFYRIAINPHQPDIYVGGVQDNGTTEGNAATINDWQRLFGGDGFQPIYDPNDPLHYFFEIQNGDIYETLDGGFTFDNISSWLNPDDRRNWDMPYFMSKHSGTVYLGTDKMYAYTNGSMQALSQDLTDGNIYGARFHNISAIAESKSEPGKLFAGTSDANMWRSLNNGASWQNITGNLPERYVSGIATSHITPGLVYVTHTGFKSNDFTPHIHKSTDYGNTWTPIAGNLPPFAINDIATYPTNDSILFVATDIGVYATTNGGNTWQRLGTNMPYVIVFDIEVDSFKNRLIAGTHGRSMMSYPLDSLTQKTITGLHRVNLLQCALMYPNPASDKLTILVPNSQLTGVEVFNTNGAIIYSQQVQSTQIEMDVHLWSKGIYWIRLRDEEGHTGALKFIRQ